MRTGERKREILRVACFGAAYIYIRGVSNVLATALVLRHSQRTIVFLLKASSLKHEIFHRVDFEAPTKDGKISFFKFLFRVTKIQRRHLVAQVSFIEVCILRLRRYGRTLNGYFSKGSRPDRCAHSIEFTARNLTGHPVHIACVTWRMSQPVWKRYPRNSSGNFPEIRTPKSRMRYFRSYDNSRTIINI